jgi:hypothetical protein
MSGWGDLGGAYPSAAVRAAAVPALRPVADEGPADDDGDGDGDEVDAFGKAPSLKKKKRARKGAAALGSLLMRPVKLAHGELLWGADAVSLWVARSGPGAPPPTPLPTTAHCQQRPHTP